MHLNGFDFGHKDLVYVLIHEPGETLQDDVHSGHLHPITNRNEEIKQYLRASYLPIDYFQWRECLAKKTFVKVNPIKKAPTVKTTSILRFFVAAFSLDFSVTISLAIFG